MRKGTVMHLPSNRLATGEIDRHVRATYKSLRWGLAALAVAFPLVLWGAGAWAGLQPQPSMSAYYFAALAGDPCVFFPMRVYLVGFLCAISAALYLYKGFTEIENWLLNTAAVLGVFIAVYPDNLLQPQVDWCPILKPVQAWQASQPLLHDWASVAMFVCLGLTAAFCAHKTLDYLPARHAQWKPVFFWTYIVIAALMVLLPLAISAANTILEASLQLGGKVFYMELAAIWCFAAYWAVKSIELSLSDAEEMAVAGTLPPPIAAAAPGTPAGGGQPTGTAPSS
jgi:hypothetical protein